MNKYEHGPDGECYCDDACPTSPGLSADDDRVLQMLAGANFGPDSAIVLPSGVTLGGDEAQALTSAHAPAQGEHPTPQQPQGEPMNKYDHDEPDQNEPVKVAPAVIMMWAVGFVFLIIGTIKNVIEGDLFVAVAFGAFAVVAGVAIAKALITQPRGQR
jgi:hypothetical protein